MPFQGGEKMTPAWAQRREALLRDCIVSPDMFHQMVVVQHARVDRLENGIQLFQLDAGTGSTCQYQVVGPVDRLGDFVVPYQHALETEVGQSHVHLYLEGLLSHLGRKVFQSCGSWSESSWYGPSPVAWWCAGVLCCSPQPSYSHV